ncbi:unnamed protein product [Blepharisma stoltei]|uniref:Uncharacterized protein n=1 Tax=Blepharisma stoltei TaxID=1481888 RepID=A0AAU9INH6_9CILI|nr:unnamed protein product [Blepharisma stoltei]
MLTLQFPNMDKSFTVKEKHNFLPAFPIRSLMKEYGHKKSKSHLCDSKKTTSRFNESRHSYFEDLNNSERKNVARSINTDSPELPNLTPSSPNYKGIKQVYLNLDNLTPRKPTPKPIITKIIKSPDSDSSKKSITPRIHITKNSIISNFQFSNVFIDNTKNSRHKRYNSINKKKATTPDIAQYSGRQFKTFDNSMNSVNKVTLESKRHKVRNLSHILEKLKTQTLKPKVFKFTIAV